MKRIFTHGNVEVQNIKIGDIHYEYEYGCYCKVEVITKPALEDKDGWRWKSKNLKTGKIIDYFIREGFGYYGPKLYDYEAYIGCKQF